MSDDNAGLLPPGPNWEEVPPGDSTTLDTLALLVLWVAYTVKKRNNRRPTKVPYGDRGYPAKSDSRHVVDPRGRGETAQATRLPRHRDSAGIDL
jgi:hypothetical protein